MAYLQNSVETLRKLDDLGFIDYPAPLWLNLSHKDPRHYKVLQSFLDHVRPIDELIEKDDVRLRDAVYPEMVYAPDKNGKVPIAEVRLPINHSLDEALEASFIVTARPLSPQELGLADDKQQSLSSLATKMALMDRNSMFAPHVNGVCGNFDGDTILFYPLTSKNKGVEFMELIQRGLEHMLYDELVVRDPKITLANRLRQVLPDLITYGLVESTKNFHGNSSYKDYEGRVQNAKLDAIRKKSITAAPLVQVRFDEVAQHYGLLRSGATDELIAAYYPLTMQDFGKRRWSEALGEVVDGEGRTQTLPIALATMDSSGDPSGLCNYGLFMGYKHFGKRKGELSFAYWSDKQFAENTSQLIADKLRIPVTPVYREKGKACANGLCYLRPRKPQS